MSITIKLPTPLRRHADQAKAVSVDAGSVGEALAALTTAHPALEPALFAAPGELKPFVRVFVEECDIADAQGLDTPLSPGATIFLVPPVAGA